MYKQSCTCEKYMLDNRGMKMDDIRKAMEKFGVPGRDCYDLPTSKKTFPDGADYRIEISGVERPSTSDCVKRIL